MAEAETYWKSLWGEEAQHNERAEWIRREQKRKVSHMGSMPIQITEITSYLSKAHNWKSPGSDQIQNYCCVKRKNQLDATYFIIYSILIHCSTCFGR